MALPVFRRFSIQDYPKGPDYLSQFFSSLNLFCETTVQALNKGQVIGENVQGQKYTTSFSTGANYFPGGQFQKIVFAYTGGGLPTAVLIGKLTKDDGTRILDPFNVSDWNLNTNLNPPQIEINYIAGLENDTNYTANFIVL